MVSPMPDRTHYCLAYAFDPELRQVALLQKNRPAFLLGKWTGVGGHVEAAETPQVAAAREFEEEAGVRVPLPAWVTVDHRENADWILDVYAVTCDLNQVRTCTEEPIQIFDVGQLPDLAQLGPMVREDVAKAQALLQAVIPAPGPTVAARRPRPA